MPTYDYRCTKCNYTFEEFQRITASPLTKCPKCKGKVERLIGKGSGIIFKGTGFYETDYKRKQSGPACPGSKGSACDCCPKKKGA
ncbi:MAG: zinc ribbon domain-containing protein [Candidatus Omnitrophica bacterium]|nr:zinc ribbon domain-containing protein [Candidatus Omnitrophota bacterium]